MNNSKLCNVLFIVGPTGCGKSKLALELAIELGVPIFNCDSIQVYQRLDIGSAKPTRKERGLIPHLLFDFVPPHRTMTAGDYRREALHHLSEWAPKGPVIVVGGSGFYVQALQKGMYDARALSSEELISLTKDLEILGIESLYRELKRIDPEFAHRIAPTDSYRILRGLGVFRSQGKTMTQLEREFNEEKKKAFPYPFLNLALRLERDQLRQRLRKRSRAMVESGLIEEVENLVAQDLSNWAPMNSVGYCEVQKFLKGEIGTKDQLVEAITNSSMRLAKRQGTWFRREKDIHWFDGENEWELAKSCGRTFLKGLKS